MNSYAVYSVDQYGMEPIKRQVFETPDIERAVQLAQNSGVMLSQIIAVKLVLASSVIEGVK